MGMLQGHAKRQSSFARTEQSKRRLRAAHCSSSAAHALLMRRCVFVLWTRERNLRDGQGEQGNERDARLGSGRERKREREVGILGCAHGLGPAPTNDTREPGLASCLQPLLMKMSVPSASSRCRAWPFRRMLGSISTGGIPRVHLQVTLCSAVANRCHSRACQPKYRGYTWDGCC
jgi:hypothetical protein